MGAACGEELKEVTVPAAEIPVELLVAGQPQPMARAGVSTRLHTSGYIITRGSGCPGIPCVGCGGFAWAVISLQTCVLWGREGAACEQLSCVFPTFWVSLPLVRASIILLACQKRHFPTSGTQKTANTRENTRETEEDRSKW